VWWSFTIPIAYVPLLFFQSFRARTLPVRNDSSQTFLSISQGACRTYKSHYIDLAKEVKLAYRNVEFYAVSCLAHKDICQKFDVGGYPTVITFAEGETVGKILTRAKINLENVAKELGLVDGGGAIAMANTETLPARKLGGATGELNNEDDVGGEGDLPNSQDETGGEDKTGAEDEDDPPHSEDEIVGDASASRDDIGGYQDPDGDLIHNDSKDGSQDNSQDEEGLLSQVVGKVTSLWNEDDKGSASESVSASNDAPFKNRPATFNGIKAGAAAAQFDHRDMDKWKDTLMKRKDKFDRKKQVVLGFKKKKQVGETALSGAATAKMKAHTPGSPEYEERQKKIAERLKQLGKRKKLRDGRPGDSGAAYPSKSRLPIKRDVSRPRLAERLPMIKRVVRMTEEDSLMLDVTLSFIHGLQFGVFTSKDPLTASKRRALKDWLDLLSVSLPAEWKLHDLINDLLDHIGTISESEVNLVKFLNEHPTPRVTWSDSCRKGVPGSAFSCGFWKLLHTVTVGVAEYRGGINLIGAEMIPQDAHTFSPLEAADSIREYIFNFFLCTECRTNFVATYDKCSNNRRCKRLTDDSAGATSADWKELSTWLWEVHNEVSVRILHERADKKLKKLQRSSISTTAGPGAASEEDEIQALWPTISGCVTCFNDDGSWNDDGVFLNLEKSYWYVWLMLLLRLLCTFMAFLTTHLLLRDHLQAGF
jgi:thiol-disulfide isomerase/thioredoxin